MKKITVMSVLILPVFCFSQVGVNTTSPAATLDIVAKNTTGTSTNVDGIVIPRVDRARAQSMVSIPTSTLIYVNSIATGALSGNAVNMDTVGYYYFNGTLWTKLGIDANTNIYNSNGTLAGNRIVTQGANTLGFTGNSVNMFSVNGATFSVDGLNSRVGIGTNAPSSILSVVNPSAGNLIDAFSAGINNCGAPCGQGTARNITLYNLNATNSQFGGVEFIPSTSATGISGASILGIDRDVTNNYAGLQFFTRNATDYAARMTIKSSGNIGIINTNPSSTLDIAAQNPTGTGTSVDGLLVPRVDRQRAQSMTGVPTSTMVFVNNISTGTQTGTAVNIDTAGYYYYDGTAWVKLYNPTNSNSLGVNIYNSDGTLSGNRTVTQNANRIAFNGTATNLFSVDGSTFSIDAANNKVGIGTTAPISFFDVSQQGLTSGIPAANSGNSMHMLFNNKPQILLENSSTTSGQRVFSAGVSNIVSRGLFTFQLLSDDASVISTNFLAMDASNGNLGIHNTGPSTTLDIVSTNATGTSTAVDGILVPRVDRQRAQSMTGVPTSTMVFVNSISTGTQTGTAVNMDAVGYYYYDGTAWVKLHNPTNINSLGVNIYNSNGVLTGNRAVTQNANTLAFTGTATNMFSVDGSTLSVDATNHRLGVGTASPTSGLDVTGTARVRTINQAAGSTVITPVYSDANGNLVKASTSNTYLGLNSNSVTIASGATATLINGLVDGGFYRVFVSVSDGCGSTTATDFLLVNISLNGNLSIKGLQGLASTGTNAAGKTPTFTESARNATGVTWTGKVICSDGADTTSLNYTVTVPSAGTLSLTNNGNVSRTYSVSVTRLN